MPWHTFSVEDLRKEIVVLANVPGANRSELASRFGISRKTLYKWLAVATSGAELCDRSRRPHTSPCRTHKDVEAAVLEWRDKHPTWGGRKIARKLLGGPASVSASTVTEVLRRHDRLDGPGAGEKRAYKRFEREHPNELWQMDFKGHFPMLCGDRCHPFDIVDDRTRYCITLQACLDERTQTVKSHLTNAFRVYGLPNEILCDNGGCWGASGARDITPLAIWMCLVGIQVMHGRPYHPQTQGKEERFHKTLGDDIIKGRGFADLMDCQAAFDEYRSDYNLIRPHDSLGLETPASIYVCSPRPFPEGPLPPPEYSDLDIVRKVQAGGILHFQGREFRVGKALRGYRVALKPFEKDGRFEVRFGRSRVEVIDLNDPA